MRDASAAILSLKPVTFRYRKQIDPDGGKQFGLIAEDVGKIDPDLVVRDDNGTPFSVRYAEVNAMLLNEFLKEHRIVEAQVALNAEQTATIAELRKSVARQAAQIKVLNDGLQKVSARLEVQKPATRVVSGQ